MLAAVLSIATASASTGVGIHVARRGSCSGRSHWSLALGHADGGLLRVRFAIRGVRAGQEWSVFMDHQGKGFFFRRLVAGPDGFLVVRRRIPDLRGRDTVHAVARDSNFEVCRGRVTL